MKNYLIAVLMIMTACNNSQKSAELAKKEVLDSVNAVNHENEVRQRTIDSMNTIQVKASSNEGSVNTSSKNGATSDAQSATTGSKKKRMSNTTKGTLIGAGAGIVAGAVTGAATSKDKGKGAIIGGVVGGAVGSGVGYGTGAKMDNKKRNDTNK